MSTAIPTAPEVGCCAPSGAGTLSDGEVAATTKLFKALAAAVDLKGADR